VTAVEKLAAKVAASRALVRLTKVYVPPHESVTKDGHPYHVRGYWREGGLGGSIGGGGGTNAPGVPSAGGAPGDSKNNPIVTDDIEVAAKALGEGKYVELNQEREVSTLLDKLAAIVDDARSKGQNAPTYDLCRVAVKGTNLFCTQSKGIPRVKMPQLSGIPIKGSLADREFPKNSEGGVDLSAAFAEFLTKDRGASVSNEAVDAKFLKASQNELNGAKVAGIAKAIETGKLDPTEGTIWVSNDDYIVDGHHRWAATVAVEIKQSTSIKIKTRRVSLPILKILAIANEFTIRMGIPQASAKAVKPGER
jgi:hypothetical protein